MSEVDGLVGEVIRIRKVSKKKRKPPKKKAAATDEPAPELPPSETTSSEMIEFEFYNPDTR